VHGPVNRRPLKIRSDTPGPGYRELSVARPTMGRMDEITCGESREHDLYEIEPGVARCWDCGDEVVVWGRDEHEVTAAA
jgi:hypothetical protein